MQAYIYGMSFQWSRFTFYTVKIHYSFRGLNVVSSDCSKENKEFLHQAEWK